MNKSNCVACNNELVNLGKIPDGILFKCSYCGSKRISINESIIKQNTYEYGNAYRERINSTKILELISLFEKHHTYSNHKLKLLDIGFGTGEFLKAISKNNISVSGLECDPDSINLMSQQNFDVHLGELGGQMNLENKYDMITLWDVIEHVSNVEEAISQINSITKSNAKVFVLTPNAGSLFDRLASVEKYLSFSKSQRLINISLNRYHLNRFTIKGLKKLFERFGFMIEHVEFIQNFSLKFDEYMDGFAPGILRWTNSSSVNKLISKAALDLIKLLRIKNKIFLTAVKK